MLRRRVLSRPSSLLKLCYPDFIFEPFHLDWFKLQHDHRETLVLAPRGHGKTTVCTCGYALNKILRQPDSRILIVSRTADQAQSIASEVRNLLALAPGIRLLFGPLAGHPWSPGSFTVSTRIIIKREPTVTAMGICGPLTSKHFDLILCDDVLDFENTRSAKERERVAQWVGTALEPTLEPGGEIHWIGTRYHTHDYYSRLLDRRLYDGLRSNPETRAAIIKGPDQSERPLWPARFTLDPNEAKQTGKIDLVAERRKKGRAIFSAQYLNDVQQMTGRIFRGDWFCYHQGLEGSPATGIFVMLPDGRRLPIKRIFQGFDPAISARDQADFSAHVTVGLALCADREPLFIVLDTIHDRMTFEGQINLIISQAVKWRPSVIGIEEVAYQQALSQEVRRRKALPIKGIRRRIDKISRAYALQGLFEDRRIWLDPAHLDLIDELKFFPEGLHDDLFDGLETAVSLARQHHRPAFW